ncbi:MAG TPA: hypothetical protein VF666_08110 [Pyrinomonadaceae bacterium]|jgi:hypothetical protein
MKPISLKTDKNLRLLSSLAVVLLCAFTIAVPAQKATQTTTVRGRINRQLKGSSVYPAAGVRVTLGAQGKKARTAYTGNDGIYYFSNTAAGDYVLSIWSSEGKIVGSYKITAFPNKQYNDIKPITILVR